MRRDRDERCLKLRYRETKADVSDETRLRSSHGQDVLNSWRDDPTASAADVEPGEWLISPKNEVTKPGGVYL